MNGNTIGTVVVLAIVIIGGWFLFLRTPASAPTENTTNQTSATTETTTTTTTTTSNTPAGVTVAYTDQGFSPNSVTVALGTTVTFVNQSTKNVWVASAKHPDHTVYSGTSLSQHCPDTTSSAFDACSASAPGGSYSFTFNKMGTWKYHDHVDASKFGTIIVTAESTSTTVSATTTVSIPTPI